MPVQRVTRKHSGKGSVSALVTIPRSVYKLWGEPSEVMIENIHDFMLLIIPSREVKVEDASMEPARQIMKAVKPDRRVESSCVKVNDHIKSQTVVHGPPLRVLVECGASRALVEYSDGYAEEILYAYDCGYRGTSPGALRRLVAWLAGREPSDEIISGVSRTIEDPSARSIIVEFETDLVIVKAVRRQSEA